MNSDAAGLGVGVAASQAEALATEVVVTVTPGKQILLREGSLRPGQHVSLMGADGPGKAEIAVEEIRRTSIYCDEWEQASHGGELAAAVETGAIARDDVTELGAVLIGEAAGRSGAGGDHDLRLDGARDPGSRGRDRGIRARRRAGPPSAGALGVKLEGW